MILITGSTGFIGRAILRHLIDDGFGVRILLAPSDRSPKLPRGVSVDVTLASLTDARGIRAALVGVESVIHLAGMSPGGRDEDVDLELEGTQNLAEAAADAQIQRLIYLSHLGANPFSAYPMMAAKGLSESAIQSSGVPYSILRAPVIFGPGDDLTTSTAMLLSMSPIILLPAGGATVLQPLWVDDLARCIAWSMEDESLLGKTIEMGGPEYLTYREIVETIMAMLGKRRLLLSSAPPILRLGAGMLGRLMASPPVTQNWLDYLAVDRTTDIDTIPRVFHLHPARMGEHLDFIHGMKWGKEFLRRLRRRKT